MGNKQIIEDRAVFEISDETGADTRAHTNKTKKSREEVLAQKRRNRILGNILLYSGISIFAVLCIIICVLLFMGQNQQGITALRFERSTLDVREGYAGTLAVETKPDDIEYALSFSSSDSGVVRVGADGSFEALKEGEARIVVESGGLKSSCLIVVKADTINLMTLPIETITLNGGEEFVITPQVIPQDAANKKFVWKSADANVAAVDEDGVVKGVNNGTTVITVTEEITGISCEVKVEVIGLELPDSIEFKQAAITLEVGDEYQTELLFTPSDISDTDAVYYTTDSDIASVTTEGVIIAKSSGSCQIEAVYENDYTITTVMEVTVIDPFVITSPEEESRPPSVSGEGTVTVDGVTYVDGILIANKTYGLPSSYAPGVQPDAYDALVQMQNAAAADGIILYIISDYRDYETQEVIYNRYVESDGRAEADRYSARPGHSEHQTGYAFDLNSLEQSFGETAEGKWLAENAPDYGFIIRYPKGKEEITGYMYEPWHVRYLGKETARKVAASGLTLEEYLGITSEYAD